MNRPDESHKIPVAPAAPADGNQESGSGEGAATALKALIRKRKMGEAPDSPAPPPARPLP
jgi:hypothetical protein